jgi:hypothetical protein
MQANTRKTAALSRLIGARVSPSRNRAPIRTLMSCAPPTARRWREEHVSGDRTRPVLARLL